jgi:hypothetical protein
VAGPRHNISSRPAGTNRIQKEERSVAGDRRSVRDLGIVTVFGFLLAGIVDNGLFDRLQLERTDGDDFEIGAALGAGDDFALVDFFFVNIEIGFALRTVNHDCLRVAGTDYQDASG